MKSIKQWVAPLLGSIAIAGSFAGFGYYGLQQMNSTSLKEKTKKLIHGPSDKDVNWYKQLIKKPKRSLDIIIDSSLNDDSKTEVINNLNQVLKRYKTNFGIKYTIDIIKFIPLPYTKDKWKNETSEKKLLNFFEEHNSLKNLNIIMTDKGMENEYSSGSYYFRENTIIIYKITERDNSAIKRTILHEIGHSLGCKHLPEKNCMMYGFNSGGTEFCNPSIKQILKSK